MVFFIASSHTHIHLESKYDEEILNTNSNLLLYLFLLAKPKQLKSQANKPKTTNSLSTKATEMEQAYIFLHKIMENYSI